MERLNMSDQNKFEELVKLLAELSCDSAYDEEISLFEDKVGTICKASGFEGPYFGIAQSDWEGIDCHTRYSKAKFCAGYYDGSQAPFLVCEWNDDLEKLEMLLKETSETLYEMYQERLKEE